MLDIDAIETDIIRAQTYPQSAQTREVLFRHAPALVAEVRAQEEKNQRLERSETQLIDERDLRTEQIGDILNELGSEAEWSNICDLGVEGVEVAACLVADRNRLRNALRELVVLKDIKDDPSIVGTGDPRADDYLRRKPLAWEAARRALELSEVETGESA